VGWWKKMPWADPDRVGVRLAWAAALVTFLAVLFALLDAVF
jgi:hypothetical protein